jgi:hypothetical protein
MTGYFWRHFVLPEIPGVKAALTVIIDSIL